MLTTHAVPQASFFVACLGLSTFGVADAWLCDPFALSRLLRSKVRHITSRLCIRCMHPVAGRHAGCPARPSAHLQQCRRFVADTHARLLFLHRRASPFGGSAVLLHGADVLLHNITPAALLALVCIPSNAGDSLQRPMRSCSSCIAVPRLSGGSAVQLHPRTCPDRPCGRVLFTAGSAHLPACRYLLYPPSSRVHAFKRAARHFCECALHRQPGRSASALAAAGAAL